MEKSGGLVVVPGGPSGGRGRLRAKGFTIHAAEPPARFVRFGKARSLRVFGKLHAMQENLEIPSSAPPSAKFLFRLLEDEGPLTERQLILESGLPERGVRDALSFLLKANLVRRTPSLRDAREAVFALRPEAGPGASGRGVGGRGAGG